MKLDFLVRNILIAALAAAACGAATLHAEDSMEVSETYGWDKFGGNCYRWYAGGKHSPPLPADNCENSGIHVDTPAVPPAVAPAAQPKPAAGPAPLPPAERAAIEKQISELEKALSEELAQAQPVGFDKPRGSDRNPWGSPTVAFGGVTMGASVGSVTGSGKDASMQGGLRARAFGEGAKGARQVDWSAYNQAQNDLENKIHTIAQLKASLEHGDQNAVGRFQEELRAQFKPQLDRYGDALRARDLSELSRPSRPLYVAEFDAQYNMVGVQGVGGGQQQAYTGFSGHGKAGVGFAMKEYGKNGCTMYFLLQHNFDGSVYYNLENADNAQVNVGVEQGPMCQIAHAVTLMMSPSVQFGGAWHELPEGSWTNSGWLNFAGHARIVVDGKVYIAVNGVYRPAMGGGNWSSSELNTTADFKVSDKWFVGLDGKASRFDNATPTANATNHVTDDRVTATATLLF